MPSTQCLSIQQVRLDVASFLIGGRNDMSSDRKSSHLVATEPCQGVMQRHPLVTEAGLGQFHKISSWRTFELAKPHWLEPCFLSSAVCLLTQGPPSQTIMR